MGKQKISVTIILAAILVAAGYLQAAGAQSSQSSGAAHWNGPSGTYPLNLGYSSQNAIKADNVKNLQIRWVFPLPSAPAQLGVGSDGVSLTPIVVSGIVYFLTNFHVVYASAYLRRDIKKVRLTHFIMIDSEGKLIAELAGESTIGFYEGRASRGKIVGAVRSFAEYELKRLGLEGSIPSENVSLKKVPEIEEILAKVRSGRYDPIKGLR